MPSTAVATSRHASWVRGTALASLLLFPLVQAIAFSVAPDHVDHVFIWLTCLAALQIVLAALVRVWCGGPAERRNLWLVAAFAFWISGQIATLLESSVTGTDGSLHSSVLLFSLFAMPILLLASINRASHVSAAAYYTDAITVLILTYAFSTYNADVIAQSRIDASSTFDLISRNFAIEELLLCFVVVVRMVAAESQDDWGYFRILAEFLGVNLVLAVIFNYWTADTEIILLRAASYMTMTTPFLLLAWRLASPLPRPGMLPVVGDRARAMFLGLSPSILTVTAVMLTLQIMERHPALARVLLTISVLSHIVRSMLTHAWFIRSRDALVASELTLQSMARLDPMTGVGNRRRFTEALDDEWDRAARARSSLAVLMIDVDYFKTYNDTYGHDAGDQCLQRVARALRVSLPRASDVVARYGGEEFVVLLPNTTAERAYLVAQRLRHAVEQLQIGHRSSPHTVVTVSIGVDAAAPSHGDEHRTLMASADRALYAAKTAGRNRVARAGAASAGASADADVRGIASWHEIEPSR